MSTQLQRALCFLTALLLAVHSAHADAFDDALLAFRKATRSSDLQVRQSALAQLVSLADLEAHRPLWEEIARTSEAVRDSRDTIVRMTAAVERKQRLVRDLETRLAVDGSLADSVSRQKSELGQLQNDLQRGRRSLAENEPWLGALRMGIGEFQRGLKASDQKKYAKALWKDLGDDERLQARLGLFEILGEVGDQETPSKLLSFLNGIEGDRLSDKRKLAKAEKSIRKAERELQEKADANRSALGSAMQQYQRLVQESTALRKRVTVLGFQMDAAAEAAGRALGRLEGPELEEAVADIVKAHSRSKGALARKTLEIFRFADREPVTAAVVRLLAETKDVEARRSLLAALARPSAAALAFDTVAGSLAAEEWQVRAAAIEALRAMRDARAIPLLIAQLAVEVGRLRSDLGDALTSLTAKSLRSNHAAWERWWKAEGGDGFQVVALDAAAEGSLTVEEEMGVSFFGIRTESQRVLFVLDVSGSMDFAMVPRDNPTDDPQKPFDEPGQNEQSRLEVARNQLVTALGGIRDGGLFNLVLYASDVWTWEDELVAMEQDVRSDVLRFVDSLDAEGATNIFGALMRAFDLAGVREDGEWREPLVDTIFVLSDGKPSIGVVVEPKEILAAVRERNQAAGIVIHAIGLSGAQDAAFLSALAGENGGTYVGK